MATPAGRHPSSERARSRDSRTSSDQSTVHEKSKQSARECRKRKKLRYQTLERTARREERAIEVLYQQLDRLKALCGRLDRKELTLEEARQELPKIRQLALMTPSILPAPPPPLPGSNTSSGTSATSIGASTARSSGCGIGRVTRQPQRVSKVAASASTSCRGGSSTAAVAASAAAAAVAAAAVAAVLKKEDNVWQSDVATAASSGAEGGDRYNGMSQHLRMQQHQQHEQLLQFHSQQHQQQQHLQPQQQQDQFLHFYSQQQYQQQQQHQIQWPQRQDVLHYYPYNSYPAVCASESAADFYGYSYYSGDCGDGGGEVTGLAELYVPTDMYSTIARHQAAATPWQHHHQHHQHHQTHHQGDEAAGVMAEPLPEFGRVSDALHYVNSSNQQHH